jgi:hypothetical protein
MDFITELPKALRERREALRKSLDPVERQRERAENLADYGPGGKWRYAPASEKAKASRRIDVEQERRTSVALYELGRLIRDHEADVNAVVDEVKNPLGPEPAWRKRSRATGVSAAEYFALHQLDETRQQRLRDELGPHAKPTKWLAFYEAATAIDPLEQNNNTTARWIEQNLGHNPWAAANIDIRVEPAEAEAVQKLRRLVQEQREKRVPTELRSTLEALSLAKSAERQAEALKVHPLPPDIAEHDRRRDESVIERTEQLRG